jgi:hypothetical protein
VRVREVPCARILPVNTPCSRDIRTVSHRRWWRLKLKPGVSACVSQANWRWPPLRLAPMGWHPPADWQSAFG